MAKGSGGTRSISSNGVSNNRNIPAEIDAYFKALEDPKSQYDGRSQPADVLFKSAKKVQDTFEQDIFTPEQEVAVSFWRSEIGYSQINKYFRGNLSSRESDNVKNQISVIDKIFKKADKEYIVYRTAKSEVVDKTNSSYTATSTSPYPYHNSNGYSIIAIRIPKGTPIIKIGTREKEILLPRGFNIKKHMIRRYDIDKYDYLE